MKRVIGLFFLGVLVVGCNYHGIRGNGDLIEENRDIAVFNKIDASGAFNIKVKAGEEPTLKISADQNLMKYIRTKVDGETLFIDSKKNLRPRKEITIWLTTEKLKSLDISGACEIEARNISAEKFNIDGSGAVEIKISGDVESFNVEISGACEINSRKFIANNVFIDASGASSINVYASNSLRTSLSGASDVVYSGNPLVIKNDISGAASVKKK